MTGAKYYYLPVSHCVEKQLALEYASKVYCIAPCLRLLMDGEDHSGRHLYTFFQAEIEWHTESVDDVYGTVEAILSGFAARLLQSVEGDARADERALQRIGRLAVKPFVRIPFAEARRHVADVGGPVNPHAKGDLTHAEEHALSMHQGAPFWLTNYPDGVRDSIYRRKADGTFATYDLVLPEGYGELATGGLRPDSPEDILRQARDLGEEPHKHYAQWKARAAIQTGGIGFGIERLIRYCAGASSVLDLRFAHDQGPNSEIGQLTVSA
ncbi:amino acid--tRNA ligase-related protein [Mesorhizobium sp. 113-3-9]|uniref:amino acid--tRNA ligase-related protein n=1 Tax=Mesorhizobium sp. 113-3-9 TaxID=2744517 RepID=UPI00406C56AC